MKIQIDGTNTLNRGAELMLVAILEQLEQNYADSKVVYNPNSPGSSYPYTGLLKFRERKVLKYAKYPDALLRKFKLPRNFLTTKHASSSIDIVLDAGGFQFSDQWNYPQNYVALMDNYYKNVQKNGTKLIFLPQAFGPFETVNARETLHFINRYADLIIAREQVSYDYLTKGGANPDKIRIYPDFTLKVAGSIPSGLVHLGQQVCIIPNKKMITHARSSAQKYTDLIVSLIKHVQEKGHRVYLLNHEGSGDLELCYYINEKCDNQLEVVTGLNAKEVKGVIGAAYMVLSSRFHGVASALSQAVPCLATSWNHKYEMLYKDYKLDDMILNLEHPFENISNKVDHLLDPTSNKLMRSHLHKEKEQLEHRIDQMWEEVFSIMDA